MESNAQMWPASVDSRCIRASFFPKISSGKACSLRAKRRQDLMTQDDPLSLRRLHLDFGFADDDLVALIDELQFEFVEMPLLAGFDLFRGKRPAFAGRLAQQFGIGHIADHPDRGLGDGS